MLLVLRSFCAREGALSLRLAAVHENSLDSRPSPSRAQALRGNDAQIEALRLLRLRVTSDECPVTSNTDSPAREAEHNPPSANSGTAPTRDRLEIENIENSIENLVERLEKSTIGAGNVKTQNYERSRQQIENKDQLFFRISESRQLDENRWLMLYKAVNLLKNKVISFRKDNHETAC